MRFNYENGFKNPDMSQKFIFSTQVGFSPEGMPYLAYVYPNPNLREEFSHNFEMGFRYFDFGFNLDMSVAYNLGTNYITLVETNPVLNEYQYENISQAHALYFELGLSYTWEKIGITPYFNGAYQYLRLVDEDFNTAKTGAPPVQLKGGLGWEKAVLGVLNLRADMNVVYNSEAQNEGRLGSIVIYNPWYTLNASFGLDFGKDAKGSLSLGVNNILDTKYQEAGQAIAAAGRHFFIALNVKI